MCYHVPARTVAHEMWCTIATTTTTTTSTVPMRPPTCFDGPARAVAHEMWCTTAYDFFGCALVIIREKQLRSYDAFLANRLGCTIAYDVSVQMSDQSLGTVVGVQMTLLAVFMLSLIHI